jgi:hypothetical protein
MKAPTDVPFTNLIPFSVEDNANWRLVGKAGALWV